MFRGCPFKPQRCSICKAQHMRLSYFCSILEILSSVEPTKENVSGFSGFGSVAIVQEQNKLIYHQKEKMNVPMPYEKVGFQRDWF